VGAENMNALTTIIPDDSLIPLFFMINTLETGGSEHQFTVLAKNINKAKFQLHLGCLSRRGHLIDEIEGVQEFPPGGSLYEWQSLRARLKLGGYLRKHHIQVAHAFDFYANLILIPVARLVHVPVIIGSHRQLGDLLSWAKFRAQAAVFRWCDAITCNSQVAANRLVAAGVERRKLVVIGNALAQAAFEEAPAALPRRSEILRVGMVARMNAHSKNHEGFLRIAAKIHQCMPDVEFVLVGDGALRPELEQQAVALGIGNRTIFMGMRRDIPSVLASFDVAVLTSDSESLSNAILEAMAAGLPVVAYDVGGNSELVNHTRGQLVPKGNESDFAIAVQRLLSDSPLRGQQGDNARSFVKENFSLDRIRRRYEDLYSALLDKKSEREFRA
jgi:glycosyltransferase involved in cell wall biosynthesis